MNSDINDYIKLRKGIIMFFFVIFCIVISCTICPWMIIAYLCFPIIMTFVMSFEYTTKIRKREKEREAKRRRRREGK